MVTRWKYYMVLGIIFGIAWSSYSVFAAPACPRPFIIEQPDGTRFHARNKGDEWLNWTETEEGYPIILNPKSKFWEYAKLNATTGLALTGQVVGKQIPIGIQKISARDLKILMPSKKHSTPVLSSLQLPHTQIPILGTRKVLVILVNFADQKLTTTESDWQERFFGTSNSAKHYYQEVSYNQLTLAPAQETSNTANNGIVTVTLTSNHPNTGFTDDDTAKQQLTKDAILAADPFVNFASFDTDDNGVITTNELHIAVVASGYETGSFPSEPSVSAHKWTIFSITAPVVDGKTVGAYPGGYIQFGELYGNHQIPIGVIVHELGHDLGTATRYLGLPDLYDRPPDGSSCGVGVWDVMAWGCWNYTTYDGDTPAHPSAWCKWYLGWLTPTLITASTVGLSFPQVETATGQDRGVKQMLYNPNGPEIGGAGEYFLMENRQKIGHDSALPGSGLLIWHIDETQTHNDNESRKLVDLEEADGLNQLDYAVNLGDAGDPYPGTFNAKTFNVASNPNSKLYDGINSNVSVINISNSATTMTADVSVPLPAISLNTPSLNFIADEGSNSPVSQTFAITNSGASGSILTWTASENTAWLTLSPTAGLLDYNSQTSVTVSVNIAGLPSDVYNAPITVSDSNTTTIQRTLTVNLTINKASILDPNSDDVNSDISISNAGSIESYDYNIPAGSLDGTDTISFTGDPNPPMATGRIELAGGAVDITLGSGKTNFKRNVTFAFTVNTNILNGKLGGRASTLVKVVYYDGNKWIVVPDSSLTGNKIQFITNHLTKFAVAIVTPPTDFSNLIVYPNPFRPSYANHASNGIILKDLPAHSEVGIYTLLREQIIRLRDDDGDGLVKWDARNENGQVVASGVYFTVVKDGSKTKLLKIAIQR